MRRAAMTSGRRRQQRRRLLLGALGAAGAALALAAACTDALPLGTTQTPASARGGPGRLSGSGTVPAPASPPVASSPAGPAAPGPIATSVQIVPGGALPGGAGRDGARPGGSGAASGATVARPGPPLLVPGRTPSPSANPSPGPAARPGASPGVLASPVPLPIVLGRPGLLAVVDAGRIVLVDPSGQHPPRTLVSGPDGSAPRWSPDGQRLMLTGGLGPAGELFVMPAGGGPPQRLTSNARPERQAFWSPRGDRIAYVLPRSSSPAGTSSPSSSGGTPDAADPEEVWLLDVATGATVKLADGFDPSWSPDGQELLYATNGQRDAQGARGNAIHSISADGQGDHPVLAVSDVPADLLPAYGLPFKPGTVRLRAPSWSPDGTRLVVSADGHTSMAMTLNERGPDRDIRPWALAYEGSVGRAHWSPDGQRIAVESLPATGVAVVVLVELASRRETPIGGPGAGFQASSPTWAADGQRLALIAASLPARRAAPRETALRLFGADGAARETLLTTPALSSPDWGRAP